MDKELYKWVTSRRLYSKSYDEFVQQYGGDNYETLYRKLKDRNIITEDSANEFLRNIKPTESFTRQDPQVSTPEQEIPQEAPSQEEPPQEKQEEPPQAETQLPEQEGLPGSWDGMEVQELPVTPTPINPEWKPESPSGRGFVTSDYDPLIKPQKMRLSEQYDMVRSGTAPRPDGKRSVFDQAAYDAEQGIGTQVSMDLVNQITKGVDVDDQSKAEVADYLTKNPDVYARTAQRLMYEKAGSFGMSQESPVDFELPAIQRLDKRLRIRNDEKAIKEHNEFRQNNEVVNREFARIHAQAIKSNMQTKEEDAKILQERIGPERINEYYSAKQFDRLMTNVFEGESVKLEDEEDENIKEAYNNAGSITDLEKFMEQYPESPLAKKAAFDVAMELDMDFDKAKQQQEATRKSLGNYKDVDEFSGVLESIDQDFHRHEKAMEKLGRLPQVAPRGMRDEIQNLKNAITQTKYASIASYNAAAALMTAAMKGTGDPNDPAYQKALAMNEEQRTRYLSRHKNAAEKAAQFEVITQQIEDIDDIGDFTRWGINVAVQMTPIVTTIMAGGFIGGKLGSVGGPVGIMAGSMAGSFMVGWAAYGGDMYISMLDGGVESDVAKNAALKYSILPSAVSILFPATVSAGMVRVLGREYMKNQVKKQLQLGLTGKAAQSAAQSAIQKETIKRGLKTVGIGIPSEGMAELIAQRLVIDGKMRTIPGFHMTREEIRSEIFNAGAAGSVMGFGMGLGAFVSQKATKAAFDDAKFGLEMDKYLNQLQEMDHWDPYMAKRIITQLKSQKKLNPEQKKILAHLQAAKDPNPQLSEALNEMNFWKDKVYHRGNKTNLSRFTELWNKQQKGDTTYAEDTELMMITMNKGEVVAGEYQKLYTVITKDGQEYTIIAHSVQHAEALTKDLDDVVSVVKREYNANDQADKVTQEPAYIRALKEVFNSDFVPQEFTAGEKTFKDATMDELLFSVEADLAQATEKTHRDELRAAMASGDFMAQINAGEITFERGQEIADSMGLEKEFDAAILAAREQITKDYAAPKIETAETKIETAETKIETAETKTETAETKTEPIVPKTEPIVPKVETAETELERIDQEIKDYYKQVDALRSNTDPAKREQVQAEIAALQEKKAANTKRRAEILKEQADAKMQDIEKKEQTPAGQTIREHLPNGSELKGITEINVSDNGEDVSYGTKTSKTSISVKGMTAEDIKQELDFEKKVLEKSRRDAEKFNENEILSDKVLTRQEKEDAIKMHKKSLLVIEQTEKIVIPFYEKHLELLQGQSEPKQQAAKSEPKENTVKVKQFAVGDGGTKGVFISEDGKLYKSIQPQSIQQTDKGFERKPIEGKTTNEHSLLSELQNNPHIPKIGEIVETSEGPAFQIEKLDEIEKFTPKEYSEIVDILDKLNESGFHVGDKVTVMRRPKTGELVVVDFSSGYKDNRRSKDSEDYMMGIESKMSASDLAIVRYNRAVKYAVDYFNDFGRLPKITQPKIKGFQYTMKMRPFDIGAYPKEGFEKLVSEGDKKMDGHHAIIEYSKPLSEQDIIAYELEYIGQKGEVYDLTKTVESLLKDQAPKESTTKEQLSDNELQEVVGRDVFKQIQRSEEQLGEGVVDRNRLIETAKQIQKADKKDELLPEHIFEALQYELGFPDNWQDLRNAIKKGGIDVNSEAIQRQIEVGVKLPKDIVEEFKKSERYKNANPELVKAVESLLENQAPKETPKQETKEAESKSILNSDVDLMGREKDEFMLPVTYTPSKRVGDQVEFVDSQGEQMTGNYRGTNPDGKAVIDSPKSKKSGEKYNLTFVVPEVDVTFPKYEDTGIDKGSSDAIKYAIENNLYEGAISEGRMTAEDAKTIIESAGLKVPESIESLTQGTKESTDYRMPITEIAVKEDVFQNRDGADGKPLTLDDMINNPEKAGRAFVRVDRMAKNWSDAKQDPIHIWRDVEGQLGPKNQTYVLSGHHRLAAATKAGRTDVLVRDRTDDFGTDYAAAAEFAKVEANTLSEAETGLERAKVYRKMRADGKSKAEIKALAAEIERSNAAKILKWSNLNPEGNLLKDMAKVKDEDGITNMEKLAAWIGAARDRVPMSDTQENQLYAWATENFKKYSNEDHFVANVREAFENADTPLKLKYKEQEVTGSQKLKELKEESARLMSELGDLSSRLIDPTNEGYLKPDSPTYQEDLARLTELQAQKQKEVQAINARIYELSKKPKEESGQSGLNFDAPPKETPKQEAPKPISKEVQQLNEGVSPWEVTRNMTEEEAAVVTKEFIEQEVLPSKQFPKRERLPIIQGEVKVAPINKPVKKQTVSESMAKITIKDDMSPQFTKGIYFDAAKKQMVATDAKNMVIIKDETITETKLENPKTKELIDARFPDYESIIPKDNPIRRTITIADWMPALNGLANTARFMESSVPAKIKIGDNEYFFKSESLRDILGLMAEQGQVTASLEIAARPDRAIVIKAGNITGITMPVFANNDAMFQTIYQSEVTSADKDAVVKTLTDEGKIKDAQAGKFFSVGEKTAKTKQAKGEMLSEFLKGKGVNIRVAKSAKDWNAMLNSVASDSEVLFSILDEIDLFTGDVEASKAFIDKVFSTINKEDGKTAFKKMAIKYHPDKGGALEVMQHLVATYDKFKAGEPINRQSKDWAQEQRQWQESTRSREEANRQREQAKRQQRESQERAQREQARKAQEEAERKAREDVERILREMKEEGEALQAEIDADRARSAAHMDQLIKELNKGKKSWWRFQYNQGQIAGFVKDGVMFLNPATLNTKTVLHENQHIWQQAVKDAARNGDAEAQAIMQKRQELFGKMADSTMAGRPPVSELSNAVYKQKAGESKEAWRNRLIDEIEAYMTSEAMQGRLDALEKNNPSLFQQVKDFIAALNEWLSGLIGMKGQDVLNMTMDEYIDAAGASALKGEFGQGKGGETLFAVEESYNELVEGFYSPLLKTLGETKIEKLPAKQWIDKFGKGEEAKWTGLTEWLGQQEGSVSKADIQQYLKDNRIIIKEKVLGSTSDDQTMFDQMETIKTKMRQYGAYGMEMDVDGSWYVTKDGEMVMDEEGQDSLPDPIKALYQEFYRVAEGAEQAVEPQILKEETYNNINDILSRRGVEDVSNIVDGWYEGNNEWSEVEAFLSDNNIDADAIIEKSEVDASAANDARYREHQLEGEKENYKEVLVTMPTKQVSIEKSVYEKDGKFYVEGLIMPFNTVKEAKDYADQYKGKTKPKADFKSSHFSEPNILVHLRMNTRTAADGSKVLFLEEVQSDWGQTGKREGFKVDSKERESLIDAMVQINERHNRGEISKEDALKQLTDNERKLSAIEKTIGDSLIPSAPFVTDTNAWTKLGLKVALKEAVRQGADKIAWTTGEQQNERYDLSKQVDWINAEKTNKGDYKIEIGPKDNRPMETQYLKENELEANLGKELAAKIITDGGGMYKGLDLQVGGKGMKGFYGSPYQFESAIEVNKDRIDFTLNKAVAEAYFEGGIISENLPTWAKNEMYLSNIENKGQKGDGKIVIEEIKEKAKQLGADILTLRADMGLGFSSTNSKLYNYYKDLGFQDNNPSNPDGRMYFDLRKYEGKGSLGIVGNVAKSLFKQEPKTVEIAVNKYLSKQEATDLFEKGEILFTQTRLGGETEVDSLADIENAFSNGDKIFADLDLVEGSTQHSIDITPELRGQVRAGLPLMQAASEVQSQAQQSTVEQVSKAFPNIDVVTDGAEVAKAKVVAGMEGSLGFVYQGKVFIDMNMARADTPIHEFGHIWGMWAKMNDNAHYQKGLQLVEGSVYEARVRESGKYEGLSKEEILDEALMMAIGERGAEITKGGFKQWLKELWASVKALFMGKPDIENMTLEQYVDAVATQLLDGKPISNVTSEQIAKVQERTKPMFFEEKSAMELGSMVGNTVIARQLEEAGRSGAEIEAITGWHKGPDGKWRVFVPPHASKVSKGETLGQMIDLPRLYQLFPEAKDLPIKIVDHTDFTAAYNFDGYIEVSRAAMESPSLASHLIHEAQHFVQHQEGLINPDNAADLTNAEQVMWNAIGGFPDAWRGWSDGMIRSGLENMVKDLAAKRYTKAMVDGKTYTHADVRGLFHVPIEVDANGNFREISQELFDAATEYSQDRKPYEGQERNVAERVAQAKERYEKALKAEAKISNFPGGAKPRGRTTGHISQTVTNNPIITTLLSMYTGDKSKGYVSQYTEQQAEAAANQIELYQSMENMGVDPAEVWWIRSKMEAKSTNVEAQSIWEPTGTYLESVKVFANEYKARTGDIDPVLQKKLMDHIQIARTNGVNTLPRYLEVYGLKNTQEIGIAWGLVQKAMKANDTPYWGKNMLSWAEQVEKTHFDDKIAIKSWLNAARDEMGIDTSQTYYSQELFKSEGEAHIARVSESIIGETRGSFFGNETRMAELTFDKTSVAGRAKQDGISMNDLGTLAVADHAFSRNERVAEIIQKNQDAYVKKLNEALDVAISQKNAEKAQFIRDIIEEVLNNNYTHELWTKYKSMAATSEVVVVQDGSGLSNEDAQAIIDGFEAKGVLDKMRAYNKEIRDKLITGRVQMLFDNGIINKESYEALTKGTRDGYNSVLKDYVPLTVDDEVFGINDEGEANYSGTGIHSLVGTGKYGLDKRHNPIATLLNQYAASVRLVKRNNFAKDFAKNAKDAAEAAEQQGKNSYYKFNTDKTNDSAGTVRADGTIVIGREGIKENSIVYFENGVEHYITFPMVMRHGKKVPNPVVQAFAALPQMALNMDHPFWRKWNAVTNIKRAMYTQYNFWFGANNFMRDNQAKWANIPTLSKIHFGDVIINELKYGFAVRGVLGIMAGKRDARTSAAMQRMEENGAMMSWMNAGKIGKDVVAYQKLLDILEKGGQDKFNIMNVMQKGLNLIGAFNDAMEMGTRVATFIAAEKAGATTKEAAWLAKNITINFEKKGSLSRQVEPAYLFYSVAFQGAYLGGKALTNKRAWKFLGTAAFVSMFFRSMFHMDDDEEKLTKYILSGQGDRKTIISIPGMETAFTLPKPYGPVRIMQALGEGVADATFGIKPWQHVALEVAGESYAALFPVMGEAANPLSAWAPTHAKVLVEIWMDKAWYDKRITSEYPGKPEKEVEGGGWRRSQHYNATTAPWAVDLAQAIEKNTRWSGGEQGWGDMHPTQIQYFLKQHTGGMLMQSWEALMAFEDLRNIFEEDEMTKGFDMTRFPITKSFWQDLSNTDKPKMWAVRNAVDRPATTTMTVKEYRAISNALEDLNEKGFFTKRAYSETKRMLSRKYPNFEW